MTMSDIPEAAVDDHYDPDADDISRQSPHVKPPRPDSGPTSSLDADTSRHTNGRASASASGSESSRKGHPADAVLIGSLAGDTLSPHARHPDVLPPSDDGMSDDNNYVVPNDTGGALDKAPTSVAPPVNHLAALAAGALQFTAIQTSPRLPYDRTIDGALRDQKTTLTANVENTAAEPPSLSSADSQDGMSRPSTSTAGVNLAPMQQAFLDVEGANSKTLPSISSTLGDITHIAEVSAKPENPNGIHRPSFSASSGSPPRLPVFQVPHAGSHASPPPASPIEAFQRNIPSPARPGGTSTSYYATYANRQSMSVDGGIMYPTSTAAAAVIDYGTSSDLLGTELLASTAASMAPGIDRMSIDNMTNPQIGGFQCTYPGCTAQPFQTQYLLNSHANVHSSNRPHYCPVKGCPRSEGGKGFKRKNEMIRHGLVHESPGYVCPYCIDREHRYPRPDNLQRHVRVHHVDKDKDDPQLRNVLSQRPEGPSRGRRRRN